MMQLDIAMAPPDRQSSGHPLPSPFASGQHTEDSEQAEEEFITNHLPEE